MEAIIQQGKNQYKIKKGDVIRVDRIVQDKKKFVIDKVLVVNDGKSNIIGQPYVENAKVNASILEEVKGDKVINFRYKPKKNYHRTVGHRQKYTNIQIDKIELK